MCRCASYTLHPDSLPIAVREVAVERTSRLHFQTFALVRTGSHIEVEENIAPFCDYF